MKKYALILFSVSIWLFWHHHALADIFNPHCTPSQLIQAITAANLHPGTDVIELPANCVYNLTNSQNNYGSVGNNGLPPITDSLIIKGHGAIIQRSSPITFRLFYVTATLTLNKVTLIGGDSGDKDGGGIYNAMGGVTWLQQSHVLSHTSGIAGGGIYNAVGAQLNLEQTTVAYNQAVDGGGLYNDGVMNIAFSTLAYNLADNTGGGVRNTMGIVNISNSTFFDNRAFNGGGLRNELGQINLSNNTIVNNHARNFGGGLQNRSSITQIAIITLSYNIIANNTAITAGAEIRNQGSLATIKANRYNLFGANGVSNTGLSVWLTGNTDMTATVPITAILTPTLALNGVAVGLPPTLALVEGSPAITLSSIVTNCIYFSNGVNPLFNDGETILTDQRLATPRDVGGQCDVGAFEFGATPPPLPVAPNTPMPVGGVAQVITISKADARPYAAIFALFLGILAYIGVRSKE